MSEVYIIAEAGVNHNGSLHNALALVEQAKDSGANAVKFQSFKAKQMVCYDSPKAEYQAKSTGDSESQYQMLKNLELTEQDHLEIIKYCGKVKIEFLSTPFDIESANLLINTLNLDQIKIASGEITNAPLLLRIAQSNKPVIMSTGMCSLADIEKALGVLAFGYLNLKDSPTPSSFESVWYSEKGRECLREKVILLHCTSEYPAPFESINLKAMSTLAEAFGLPVGFSDHSSGIAISIAAVAMGARVIEKHFTLDKTLPGPDHQASLEPDELKALVVGIRAVEKAIGTSYKIPATNEIKNIDITRKSLVAAQSIQKGEIFTLANLTCKRPGTGVSPLMYWSYVGKPAQQDYQKDEFIH
jgi:N-acetylneuraminate synthase